MEIINFSTKRFTEIPTTDNPAYDKNAECIIIFKDANENDMFEVVRKVRGLTGRNSCQFICKTYDIDVAIEIAECFD